MGHNMRSCCIISGRAKWWRVRYLFMTFGGRQTPLSVTSAGNGDHVIPSFRLFLSPFLSFPSLPYRYVYTGRSAINNIEDAIYTRDAAEKYRFLDLANTCTEYIESHLEADDVCTVVDYSLVTYGAVKDDVVEDVILDNAESVLSSAAFTISTEQTVNFVLDRVQGVPTKVVIKAVLRWAGAQCGPDVANWEYSGTVAAAVRKFLPKLKFLALSVRQMTKFIAADATWDILSPDEACAILCEIIEPGRASPLPEWLNLERDIFARPKSTSREPPPPH
ncbi:BTB/POZ domain-containing protein 9-like isoform X1 [Dermacentor albipictus]|uniref:BTB/POZ domain-containing protein 9-like isoform X1 n=1 Tax=Dermacentor albipictus TaxID=60249 RepID=UPI0038FD16A1